ncbi:MAG: hypothetical protein K9K66_15970 [Desulfarculaceae bacterium]|nr:hypothetical protein [Desulfarculaceae bacterium]MCF8073616.1 hypothetical protein [Desulfarculaceae bacterium]MCF8103152.1 hypothetical protein [Desulfarculaceae bacterium]MCF8115668.1 hypothetical protein [Desulfarculaceae bacterium]
MKLRLDGLNWLLPPLVVVAVLVFALAATPGHAADYIIKFGVMSMAMEDVEDGGGYVVSQETNIIPKELDSSNFRYGFTIQSTSPAHPTITYCEVVTPPAPGNFEFNGFSRVKGSANTFRSATLDAPIGDFQNPAGDYRWVYYLFDPADNTPLGSYLVRVFVNNKLVKEIPFRIVDPVHVAAASGREQGLKKKFAQMGTARLEKETREGVVIDGKRYWSLFDYTKLGPSPVAGLPSAFQPGEYYILGYAGPEVENLALKIYRDNGKVKLKVWDRLFNEKVFYEIVPDAEKLLVDGKEIPLVGKIQLGPGFTIEIVCYVYPYLGIIARTQEGEPWGQFFKKMADEE